MQDDIRRGAFHSVDDLQNAITRYIDFLKSMEQGATFRVTVPTYEAELKTGVMCLPMVHSSQQARMA
jgi:hypothetical protein